jgi:xanthine dehydrogenase YagT iron-sulfur-binding subunit
LRVSQGRRWINARGLGRFHQRLPTWVSPPAREPSIFNADEVAADKKSPSGAGQELAVKPDVGKQSAELGSSIDGVLKMASFSGKAGGGITRRNLLKSSAAGGAAAAMSYRVVAQDAEAASAGAAEGVSVRLTINGAAHRYLLDARVTLLDLLREDLNLTGTKVGCNHGQCGACTVLLDGIRVNSCLMLAAMADGKAVTTIEGLGAPEDLHPMQAAFIDHDGFQCGYCTPGQILSAIGCVTEGHAGSEGEIREYMSGNLCRCGAYKGIVEAVVQAREETLEWAEAT